MRPVLLIDFGSTYTKVTAADTEKERILGTASSFTTQENDIGEGLERALSKLHEKTGVLHYEARLACSSAAGGLRMAVSGLVPELTAEAARLAALGAGAKLASVYSYELTRGDLLEIENNPPDIFLLTGGTDGGNRDCVTENAKQLAKLKARFPILFAGNRSAAEDIEAILSDFPLTLCPNVMPRFGELNIAPVQREIRNLFLSNIVHGKGLSKTKELLSGILMPTPSAILSAMRLLSKGCGECEGIGDLLGIDVGGATTDIYSIGQGEPDDINIIYKGFEEPEAKRSVEGDLGVRLNVWGIIEETGIENIAQSAQMSVEALKALIVSIESDKKILPEAADDALSTLDRALAMAAIDIATRRHAGTLEEVYTPMGMAYIQTGKNLRKFQNIVMTGGSLIHANDTMALAKRALYSAEHPASLRPLSADVYLDTQYILAAMGVLAEREPLVALRIMKKELTTLGRCQPQGGTNNG